MENENLLNERFIEIIKERLPERGQLTKVLTESLDIEKEAVYRRLRGEVPFTFAEVAKIAIQLGIPLDAIAEGSSPISRSFNIRFIEFINPDKIDLGMLESFTNNVKSLESDPESESGSISSIIPTSLCVSYKYIYKFYLFKWFLYQTENPWNVKYSDINPPERLNEINAGFVKSVQSSPQSVYIFDEQFIEYLVKDIKYFFHIRLISEEDVKLLKDDIYLFLNDLERYTNRGAFDTGKKVYIYISNLHFEATYNYIDSKYHKLTMIRSFTLSDAYSLDEKIFQNMKRWTQFLKRTSILISESGEIERIRFFDKQREMVDSL